MITTFILLTPIGNAYSHGLGLDKTSPIDVGEKRISITVEMPMYLQESSDKQITISAIDEKIKQNPKNVTFLVGIFHQNEMLIRNYFFAPDGIVRLNIHPTTHDEVKILGKQDSILGAYHQVDGQPITIESSKFNSGGLYSFEIELRTIDDPKNIVENLGIFKADVSITETTVHKEIGKEGSPVTFRLKSYFDKITQFNYDPEKKLVTFEMPFDWNDQKINHIAVVHEEIHFPKDFSEFLSPSYVGKVNNVELFKSSVTIDDYTEEHERIVHFVLLSDHLKFLKTTQKKIGSEIPQKLVFTLSTSDSVDFPLKAMTKNEQVQIDLSWEPLEIRPDSKTKFVFTFRDGTTGDTLRNTKYDFVVLQQGQEIHRKTGNAVVGGSFEEYTFSDKQTGPTIIRFENIRGTEMQTEFGIVVVPEFQTLVLFILLSAMTGAILLTKNFTRSHLSVECQR